MWSAEGQSLALGTCFCEAFSQKDVLFSMGQLMPSLNLINYARMVRLKADDPGHALGCQVHSNEAAFRSQ